MRPRPSGGSPRTGPWGQRRDAAILSAVQGLRRASSGLDRLLAQTMRGPVSAADLLALHYIAHAGSATPGALMEYTGLTSGSVTTLLDRLESEGYVTRRRTSQDRRIVRVVLRPGAHQRVMRNMIDAHQEAARIFDRWRVSEIESLIGLLERLRLEEPRSSSKPMQPAQVGDVLASGRPPRARRR